MSDWLRLFDGLVLYPSLIFCAALLANCAIEYMDATIDAQAK